MISPRVSVALFWLGAGLLGSVSAETTPAPAAHSTTHSGATGLLFGRFAEGSVYDRLWSVPVLYKNDENPFLQEFAILGQVQAQYASGFGSDNQCGTRYCPESGNWGDIEARRFRLGVRGRLLKDVKFHTLWDLHPDFSPRIYKRTVETAVTYAPCDQVNLSAGKVELKFTREQEISSREILTFERSQIINMFYGGELTGAWVSGKNVAGGWFYEAGAYGNDRPDEWSDFDGGTILMGKLGYDFTRFTDFDHAQAGIHYLHNTHPGYRGNPNDPASPLYSDCVSLYSDITEGRFSLISELFWGDGVKGRADVCGVSFLPAWFITDKLQWVSLLELAGSREENGVILPSRYEGQVPDLGDKSGDLYFSGYSGLNYYFYGHKLKVMSGVKYSSLSGGDGGGDYHGWTWLAGLRMAF